MMLRDTGNTVDQLAQQVDPLATVLGTELLGTAVGVDGRT
jgi:hypothetical protein